MQNPIVKIGTELPQGTVVAIRRIVGSNGKLLLYGVDLNTQQGVKTFSLSQIERFINDARSLSQA